jgi:hypothetical protein
LGGLGIVKTGSDRTKSEAKAKLKEVLRDYQDGLAIVPSDYTARRHRGVVALLPQGGRSTGRSTAVPTLAFANRGETPGRPDKTTADSPQSLGAPLSLQASRTDHAGEPAEDHYQDAAFGFYWTEGLTVLGWAQDAVPTLEGGSSVGIPCPPGIWIKSAEPGRKLIIPSIEEAEELQGFDRGWTKAAESSRSNGPRWKLVGNAVTVGVSQWLVLLKARSGPLSP